MSFSSAFINARQPGVRQDVAQHSAVAPSANRVLQVGCISHVDAAYNVSASVIGPLLLLLTEVPFFQVSGSLHRARCPPSMVSRSSCEISMIFNRISLLTLHSANHQF